MKKILSPFLLVCMLSSVHAQDAADKKVQAGLILGSGINFQKMGTKRMESNGVGFDWTLGTNVMINFSETIGLTTGLEFDFENLKYKTTNVDGETKYYFLDSDILSYKDGVGNASASVFSLESRNQKAVYLTVPTMFTFKTSFFGFWRYFAKFGLRNSFLMTSKTDDTGSDLSSSTPDATITMEGMKSSGDLFFFKSAVGGTLGAEWNFSGSTSLVVEAGYYYGFTPLHTPKNTDIDNAKNSLFADQAGTLTMFNNKATQNQVMLKVSILF
jgi:hypothetical protein